MLIKVYRSQVKPGDIVHSSHGYRILVTGVLDNAVSRVPERHIEIRGHLHANPDCAIRNERYPANSLITVEVPDDEEVVHTVILRVPAEYGRDYAQQLVTAALTQMRITVDEYHFEKMTEDPEPATDEYPPCGDPIDYCQGYGEIGPRS